MSVYILEELTVRCVVFKVKYIVLDFVCFLSISISFVFTQFRHYLVEKRIKKWCKKRENLSCSTAKSFNYPLKYTIAIALKGKQFSASVRNWTPLVHNICRRYIANLKLNFMHRHGTHMTNYIYYLTVKNAYTRFGRAAYIAVNKA